MFACLHAPGNLPLLVECARHFSPLIEETSPDTVVFDAHGLRLAIGGPERIAVEISLRVGLPANIALASNPDAAAHAARGFKGVTIIPPGQEAAALGPLPLCLLGGSPDVAAVLDTWGLRTFGEFSALPPVGVAARLGEEGIRLQELARGTGNRLLKLREEPAEYVEEVEPDSPVELIEPLLFLLSGMLNNLCNRLRSHSLASNELRLRLELERAPDHTAALRLPVPMLDAKVFLKLFQLELYGRPPRAAVERVRIELKPVETRVTQRGLFLPPSPEPERLEITLARIRSLVGESNVGAPELVDTHRPDSFRFGPLALVKDTSVLTIRTKLALRRFRPPCPAHVWCSADDRPSRISSGRGSGPVLVCGGPWDTSGDWWTGEPWHRVEWDIEIWNLGLLRIHQDCKTRLWQVEGSYD